MTLTWVGEGGTLINPWLLPLLRKYVFLFSELVVGVGVRPVEYISHDR